MYIVTKVNYYNEHDIKTAQWLQALIDQKLIPQGHVDTRSIVEVTPNDLRNYTQCHFFAGIGGWSFALQLAGIPATTHLWTGSCPCQPFSTAGKGLAQADERHLWPVFFELVRQCRPDTVFGEQVASAISKGWLDGIQADLESEGYACGSAVLGAHSVGAPHIRQRLYWVADAAYLRRDKRRGSAPAALQGTGTERSSEHTRPEHYGELSRRPEGLGSGSSSSWMDDTRRQSDERRGEFGDVGHATSEEQSEAWQGERSGNAHSHPVQDDSRLVLSNGNGCSQGSFATTPTRHGNTSESAGSRIGRVGDSNSEQTDSAKQGQPLSSERLLRCWNSSRLVACRDGKTRRIPTEPAFFPLAHGLPARVVRLRGYGNAIVPQVAAEFIRAFYETQEDEDFC